MSIDSWRSLVSSHLVDGLLWRVHHGSVLMGHLGREAGKQGSAGVVFQSGFMWPLQPSGLRVVLTSCMVSRGFQGQHSQRAKRKLKGYL